jgi:hypothetical protein
VTTIKRVRKSPQQRIVQGMRDLWDARAAKNDAEKDAKEAQDGVIATAKANGWTKENVKTKPLGTFETDELVVTGHLMMNTTDILDSERFIEWLKKNNLWAACSTQALDMRKVEAEVAAGNIKKADLKRFTTTQDVAPFVRFDKKAKVVT